MSVSVKTSKMLWGRSASRCNFPGCKRQLVMDATETDDESLVGQECHIVARKKTGPRGKSTLNQKQRDKYDNLILMCNVHHKLIDDQPDTYTIDKLKEIKKNHEEWVKQSLSFDVEKQRDDELYSFYIDQWCKMADISNWRVWTSYLLGAGQLSISKKMNKQLNKLRKWLFTRIWLGKYKELEASFKNFYIVLEDLYRIFHKHSKETHNSFEIDKFYKIDYWDKELYSKLHKEFEYHVDLVEDLVLELTRAANYICDKIRKFILPNFRIKKGILLTTYGPCMDLTFKTVRTEYEGDERVLIPYPGLQKFKKIREKRDSHFGAGVNSSDPKFLAIYNKP